MCPWTSNDSDSAMSPVVLAAVPMTSNVDNSAPVKLYTTANCGVGVSSVSNMQGPVEDVLAQIKLPPYKMLVLPSISIS